MTLYQLLQTLQSAKNMVVTVLDGSNKELVKFFAEGYENIVVSILSQDVAKLTITNQNAITVVVGEVSA